MFRLLGRNLRRVRRNSPKRRFYARAEATADIAGSSADYVFATDNDTFADHFTGQDSVNKTIVLTDDIEVAAALVSKGKVGIDLNGHTLTLHADLKISYSTGTEGLGIINGKTGGGIAGTGRYKISGNDCYLIDDALVAKIDYPVDDTNAESIFGSLSSILDTRLKSLDNEKPYYHEDDLSALFDGLNFYRDYKEFSVSYGKDSVIGTVTNADGTSYTGIVPDRIRLALRLFDHPILSKQLRQNFWRLHQRFGQQFEIDRRRSDDGAARLH